MDIKIDNLTKRYGIQTAVDHVSFEVKTGEILGFLGPNGAGKTTTMKMITGYIQPDEGEVLIGNQSMKTDADQLKKNIGYLPEHNPLYLEMPVMDYLGFVGALQGIPSKEIDQNVKRMVSLCGLNREKHKKIGQLSKGYRQRVGLAQAMIHNPEILVLDEPTTGLDPNQIVEIRELIREIGKEKTVILSTHILPEVEATCDRILIINRAQIVANGTAQELKNQAEGRSKIILDIEGGSLQEHQEALIQISAVAEIETIEQKGKKILEVYTKPGQTINSDIFNLCVEKNWTLNQLTPYQTNLEDVFRGVTKN